MLLMPGQILEKKLEKMEDWHDRSLNELLREAQKVYVRRDEEKAKIEAKVMVATMRESNFQRNLRPQMPLLIVQVLKEKTEPQYKKNLRSTLMPAFFVGRKVTTKEIVPIIKRT